MRFRIGDVQIRKRITDWCAYLTVRVIVCLVQAVRIETCEVLADFCAWLAYDRLRFRRTIVEENLKHAFPHFTVEKRDQLGRQMWRHIILLVCELAHAPRKMHKENWQEFVTARNIEAEIEYLLADRPVVVVSAHFGNFEVGGLISALLGYPTYTMARTLDNPFLDRFMRRFREATGQYIVPKRGSSYQVEKILEQNGTLMILGDQAAGPKGCWIEFFGRPASCHKSIALFSLTQKAPMVVCYAKRRGTRPMQFELGVLGVYDPLKDGPRDVQELSQWYSDLLAEAIQTAPDQYWWLHRRWKEPPQRARRRAVSTASEHAVN